MLLTPSSYIEEGEILKAPLSPEDLHYLQRIAKAEIDDHSPHAEAERQSVESAKLILNLAEKGRLTLEGALRGDVAFLTKAVYQQFLLEILHELVSAATVAYQRQPGVVTVGLGDPLETKHYMYLRGIKNDLRSTFTILDERVAM